MENKGDYWAFLVFTVLIEDAEPIVFVNDSGHSLQLLK